MDLYGGYFGRPSAGLMDVNIVTARSVNPTARGSNLAGIGDAANPMAIVTAGPAGSGPAVNAPAGRMFVGKPLAWWTGMLVLVALIFITARRIGNESEFANIRASTYNVALITFVSVLGITLLKTLAVRLANVPGFGGFASVVIAA